MKKYILPILVLFVSLGVVIFYFFRWNTITSETDKIENIRSLSQKVEILNQKQSIHSNKLRDEINYDDMAFVNKKLNYTIDEFLIALNNSKYEKFKVIGKKIEQKNVMQNYIYEDMKMSSAIIKNSIKWLTNNYNKYINEHEQQNSKFDTTLLKYIFDAVNKNYDELITGKYVNFSQEALADRIDTHLDIVRDYHNDLVYAKNLLVKNDIIGDINEINSYIDVVLKDLEYERSVIVKFLLISTVFLILFGMIIYIKEVISNIKIAKLKKELQQFADALNESAIVSKTDTKGSITYVNEKFCEISGYSREELIGKNHNIIRNKDMPSDLFRELWATIKKKKIFKATILNRAKDGHDYYVDSVIIPMMDVDNEITEYLAVRYDVTTLKESINNAVLAQKAKDEFLSNMSHELRTPLNAINGFGHILKKHITDVRGQQYIKNILDSTEHLIGLINDILDLSKLQSGKFTLDYHDFNLEEKIILFMARFESQVAIAEVNMDIDLDDNLKVDVSGDWLRTSQIITNLISNALKFTPKGKSVHFAAHYDSGILYFSVEDEGIGMSKEAQEKIFKPFEQADSSTTRKFGGTGLGLSIVLNLVEQMKGSIELTSEEGKGSKFEVSIPMQEVLSLPSDNEAEQEDDKPREELTGHILIAEDNKTNQMLIGIIVDDFGLTYTIVNDGAEAVEEFGKGSYDLVLMDENMPNLNGISAMKQIKEKYNTKVPVIALTANVMQGDKERFLEAGMSGYVAKPIDVNELYNAMNKCLSKK